MWQLWTPWRSCPGSNTFRRVLERSTVPYMLGWSRSWCVSRKAGGWPPSTMSRSTRLPYRAHRRPPNDLRYRPIRWARDGKYGRHAAVLVLRCGKLCLLRASCRNQLLLQSTDSDAHGSRGGDPQVTISSSTQSSALRHNSRPFFLATALALAFGSFAWRRRRGLEFVGDR